MKIPRIVIRGPKERVATSRIDSPKTPMKVRENRAYRIIGIMLPKMIAFLNNFSWPFISFLSSGIEVKPRRANITTPIGTRKFVGFVVSRFCGSIWGRNFMKMPVMIAMIAMTPQVSIFLSPFSPSLKERVIISQKIIPKRIGGVFGDISFERDCPSPIR